MHRQPTGTVYYSNRRLLLLHGWDHHLPNQFLTLNAHPVFAWTSSTVTPSARSINSNVPSVRSTSKTASSVMIWLTVLAPVNGSEHFWRIFGLPSLAQCSITTITLVLSGLDTRSIAPPMPVAASRSYFKNLQILYSSDPRDLGD